MNRGCPRMVPRIILEFFLFGGVNDSRIFKDGLRMAQDGLKDHSGDFS